MASLIPGFEYDIFISYRQRDNKHDGWVTGFVDNLKGELESAFKEEISVYFDINPHDGLLETHDVPASLKDKLKCLVFIPIISRTYCDPKAFAWEHEFKAFVDQASHDQFGLKVKLPSGNVASRVLPVRIYDLEEDDVKLCETVLGGVLRGIEFIYKEPGVNRPLKPDDDEKLNLNKSKYLNQMNKVANAAREILTGMEKFDQKPDEAQEESVKPISFPLRSNKTKILIASLIVLTLIIAGFFLIPRLLMPEKALEKSIAVLPFVNDSPDEENTFFINGIMDEILNNLQKINDFRVLSRTSTEQYRGANKPSIPKIAKALNVNYIVEGSGQKYGNTFRLRVQLIVANNEKHLWAESYEQEITGTKDIFKIQSTVAKAIADALKTTITPIEKQIIEKTPTSSLTAYDFFRRGWEELFKYGTGGLNRESVKRAEALFRNSLKYDSTYAMAYVGLANAYWKKYYLESFAKNYLDSMLVLANTALSWDNQLADAYFVRGGYYDYKGDIKLATAEYDEANKCNPNYWTAYYGKGMLYEGYDLRKSIENFQKAASLNHGPELPEMLNRTGQNYYRAGFPEKGNSLLLEALKLDGDSVKYGDNSVDYASEIQGDCKMALDYFEKRYLEDTTNAGIQSALGYFYSLQGAYKESLKYYKKLVSGFKSSVENIDYVPLYIGYAYWQNGYQKEAEYYFDKQIKDYTARAKFDRPGLKKYAIYGIAGVYAFRGDKTRAYENLRVLDREQSFGLDEVTLIKKDPLFASIRNEPEFQNIVKDMESKYLAEHERVRKWLEEQEKF